MFRKWFFTTFRATRIETHIPKTVASDEAVRNFRSPENSKNGPNPEPAINVSNTSFSLASHGHASKITVMSHIILFLFFNLLWSKGWGDFDFALRQNFFAASLRPFQVLLHYSAPFIFEQSLCWSAHHDWPLLAKIAVFEW